MQLESTLTCPNCGHQSVEAMSTDACQFFYDCKGCGERLKPLAGDCCVFCSYGSVPCPPIQKNGNSACSFRPRLSPDLFSPSSAPSLQSDLIAFAPFGARMRRSRRSATSLTFLRPAA